MIVHGMRPDRAESPAEPVGDRRGTVPMIPGRASSCDMSLLAWTTRALQATGWTVLQAEWNLSGVPVDPREFIECVAQQLDEMERQPGPVLVVAKSLGTLAAHWAAEQGYPAGLAHACAQRGRLVPAARSQRRTGGKDPRVSSRQSGCRGNGGQFVANRIPWHRQGPRDRGSQPQP